MADTLEAFTPSIYEINYFVVASLLLATAYTASRGSLTLETFGLYLLASVSVLLLRELGQRTIAHWMEADVKLDLSIEGSAMTLFGTAIALLTDLTFLLLVPVSNSFSLNEYEQWGKEIDAMWQKRMAWIASGGVITMFVGWLTFYWIGEYLFAEALSFFLIFQLLPADYPMIPTGTLDGAYIIRQSDFIWMIFFGLSLLSLVLV